MFFFFFKQKTAYEMRISDWSSDVCSSDLQVRRFDLLLRGPRPPAGLAGIDQLIALRRNPLPQKEGGGGLSVWWAEVRVILAPLEAAIVQGIPLPGQLAALRRSEERRVGAEGVSTVSTRCTPNSFTINQQTPTN